MKTFYKLLFSLFILLLFISVSTFSQSSITTVYYSTQTATTATSYTALQSPGAGLAAGTYTYKYGTNVVSSGNYQRLDSFIAGGLKYTFLKDTPVVKLRRVNNASVTGKRIPLFFESDGATIPTTGTGTLTPAVGLKPGYEDSLESIFARRIFNIGIDNLFMNSTATNNNNIERMDIIFRGGMRASDSSKAGFTVFDRGASGSHDSVVIAAIKTVDASGNPTAYYPAVLILPAYYGSIAATAFNYHGLRKEEGETQMRLFIANANQQRDGVFVSFGILGVRSNAIIYGYSLFATDVNRTSAANLVDYTNATNFPTGSYLGSAGGIDLLAVTGVASTTSSIVVLPLSVEAFNATFKNNTVWVHGTIQNPEQLQFVTLERSSDGVQFSPLKTFSWQGGNDLSYIDEQPMRGANYYRLRLTGQDDQKAYSTIALVQADATATNGLLYPVPVRGHHFSIAVPGLRTADYTLSVVDMGGKAIFQQTLSGNELGLKAIQLPPNTSPGIYVVYVNDKNNRCVFRRNVVVQP